ncbi:MAG: radical SAM protein [Thermoanaerobaculia bacterium]|nr:radical SAM protein [Thermoanaerobaculia bacterium]
METARGCPFRCRFCSVWQQYGRTFRERSIGAVADDFEAVGPHVFVVDDLFWNHPSRSLELARELRRRGVEKRWILVQSRCDLVAGNPDLLEEWRPLARDFDVFFGLEAASNSGLEGLDKDATVSDSVRAAEVARSMGYGVTGNFVVDPEWGEEEFWQLWRFVEDHGFQRCGYTILTPLPGTEYFGSLSDRLEGQPWFKYDMHHVLWEPRLGMERFFELYAETWRRSILNLDGEKRWWDWIRQIRPRQIPYLTRVLLRTQRMMKAEAYLEEQGEVCPRHAFEDYEARSAAAEAGS